MKDALLQDLRFSIRMLGRAPVFTAVAALTIALGVGATTAIFSVVDGVLLTPLRYPQADRIVRVLSYFSATGRTGSQLSGPDLTDVRTGVDVFDAISVFWGGEIGVRAGDQAKLTGTWFVNTTFFNVFGVAPAAGRVLVADDVGKAAVVSSGFADRQYGTPADAIGKTLLIDTKTYQIVGVMPAGFHFPQQADVWVPIADQPENMNRSAHNYATVARVKPGLSVDVAHAALATLSRRLARSYPDTNATKAIVAVPLLERAVGPMRGTLYLLMGAVVLLFLIACANVANLLLARATARSREMALRAALGAGRGRIVLQLIVESLVLAALGGAAGVALAYAGVGWLVRMAPVALPRLDEIAVDPTVLGFAALASVVASVVFGLAPAWHASKVDLRERLTEGGSRGAIGSASNRLRTGLAIAEIGLAVVLAIGGGLLFRSFVALSHVELGYHTDGVLIVQAHLPTTEEREDQSRAVDRLERLFPALTALPGVQAASATVGLPLGSMTSNGSYAVEGRHVFAPGQDLPSATFRLASPGYFQTLGIPVRRGREFSPQDRYDNRFVAIISESLARETFPGVDPIGQRIQCGLDSLNFMTVVGVVGDIRDVPGTPPGPELYMPIAQHPGRGTLVELVVRSSLPPMSLAEIVREQIRKADPEVATKFTSFDSMAADATSAERFRTWLVGAFAGLALLLAIAGVYGLLTYLTAQRAPELGVRIALGATPRSILGLVLSRAALMAAAGLTIGVVLALVASRALSTMVFGVTSLDPLTYGSVLAGVLLSTLAAAAVPAWRASRIDPISVIRQ